MVLKGLLKYVKKTLDHQVPKKQKFVHGNHLPFYEKKKQYIGLGFAINISKIKLTKTKESMQNNKLHLSYQKKSKKENYKSRGVRNIIDRETFWKRVQPFLSNKIASTQKITLTDIDKIVKK